MAARTLISAVNIAEALDLKKRIEDQVAVAREKYDAEFDKATGKVYTWRYNVVHDGEWPHGIQVSSFDGEHFAVEFRYMAWANDGATYIDTERVTTWQEWERSYSCERIASWIRLSTRSDED